MSVLSTDSSPYTPPSYAPYIPPSPGTPLTRHPMDDTTGIMAYAFKFTNPHTQTMAYHCYKSMFMKCPHRFTLTMGPHQNHLGDELHFSVDVDVADGWLHKLHFYGYYNNGFILKKITAMTKNRAEYITETVATFN